MMKYKMLFVFAVNLLFCTSSYSLTLGTIEVSSKLTEPFKAHIPVLNTDVSNSETLKAMLAPDYAYLNARSIRQLALKSLELSLNMNDSGNYVISLSSNEPINELFFDLIIDLGTLKKRVSKEYTVLLDPVEYVTLNTKKSFHVKTALKEKTKINTVVKKSIGEESHGMDGSAQESHGMESSIGEESHDMDGSSQTMTSSVGDASHDM